MVPPRGVKKPTVLVATDFMKPAQRAFGYALKMATALDGRLVILHVLKGLDETPGGLRSEADYLKPLKTAALLELGRLSRIAQDAGLSSEPKLVLGDPVTAVLEEAQSRGADLIVLGTHGRTGWDRLQVGSTAIGVERRAPQAVLTVRGVVAGDAKSAHRPTLHHLLVATDFSPAAQAALNWAARLAKQGEATLLLVHALEESPNPGGPIPQSQEQGRKGPDDHQPPEQRLETLVSSLKGQGLTAEGICVSGMPVQVILDEAARCAADVIVMGTEGKRGLSRMMLGSVAEQVIRRSGCPVLTAKRGTGNQE